MSKAKNKNRPFKSKQSRIYLTILTIFIFILSGAIYVRISVGEGIVRSKVSCVYNEDNSCDIDHCNGYLLENGATVFTYCSFGGDINDQFAGKVIGNPTTGDTVEIKNATGDGHDFYLYSPDSYIKKISD